MKRKLYKRLINLIYLLAVCVWCGAYIIPYFSHDAFQSVLFREYNWVINAPRAWPVLFLAPIVCTLVVIVVVRLVGGVEPLTAEERQKNLLRRIPAAEIYMLVFLLLLLPVWLYFSSFREVRSNLGVFFGIFVAQYLFSLVLTAVIWLVARVRKSTSKVALITLFILLWIASAAAICRTIARYNGVIKKEEVMVRHAYDPSLVPFDKESEKYEVPENKHALLLGDVQELYMDKPDMLAATVADALLDLYDINENFNPIYDGIIPDVSELFQYNSETEFTIDNDWKYLSTPEDRKNGREREQYRQQQFFVMQALGNFYKWYTNNGSEEEIASINSFIEAQLLVQADRYDYDRVAALLDALDASYRDLEWQSALDNGTSTEGLLGEMYDDLVNLESDSEFAEQTSYADYMEPYINPYIVYVLEQTELSEVYWVRPSRWIYSFWARRYGDGTYFKWLTLLDQIREKHPNTTFPQQTMDEQNRQMRRAEACIREFLDWYKINYDTFQKLKVAEYNAAGELVKIDPNEFTKYSSALDASEFFAPKLIILLVRQYIHATDSAKMGGIESSVAQWLQVDPLLGQEPYQLLAFPNDLRIRTSEITEPNKRMIVRISTDDGQPLHDIVVTQADTTWYIAKISHIDSDLDEE